MDSNPETTTPGLKDSNLTNPITCLVLWPWNSMRTIMIFKGSFLIPVCFFKPNSKPIGLMQNLFLYEYLYEIVSLEKKAYRWEPNEMWKIAFRKSQPKR